MSLESFEHVKMELHVCSRFTIMAPMRRTYKMAEGPRGYQEQKNRSTQYMKYLETRIPEDPRIFTILVYL